MKLRKVPNVTLTLFFMRFQNMLTFFALKCFFPKKTVNGHQFREKKVACECRNKKLCGFTLVAII